ncbi:hypothetical protein RHGRI_007315 [Rhododendron griersonianum]|uniref:Uncharacterized protein n=1 Tax=Rhododendron griersonianum TaxID=479676 RepID=A0AAV6KZF0_9ERIC|nr:hypothetical protein RHGRI_007315 [Rhododendron griersonianum]
MVQWRNSRYASIRILWYDFFAALVCLMDAASKGALQAEKPASRFKIGKEADEFSSIPTLGNLAYLQVR